MAGRGWPWHCERIKAEQRVHGAVLASLSHLSRRATTPQNDQGEPPQFKQEGVAARAFPFNYS